MQLVTTFADLDLVLVAPSEHRTVIVPVHEGEILAVDGSPHALVPSRRALDICRDKGLFAEFALQHGFDSLVPRTHRADSALEFPVVVKRRDLAAGNGVRTVASSGELADTLREAPWAGHDSIIQEYVIGGPERVTHGVCVNGRWTWSATFEYVLPEDGSERPGGDVECLVIHDDSAVVRLFEEITRALDFTGVCNIDYRMRDGSPVVFEINPRFGYSLMREAHVTYLAGLMSAVIRATSTPVGHGPSPIR